ncbi:siroheme synthase [Spirochaetia bacterium]|nr:siroheme synthase [Spirochaetia bacterium]
MPRFPLFISLEGLCCVIVGGGAVAERKVFALLDFGARIMVFALDATEPLKALALEGRITLRERAYGGAADIRGAALVLAATDDRELNRRIAEDARNAGIPVNVADDPDLCTFFFPALVRRGDLVAGISSSGACPGLVAGLRKQVDAIWPPELGEALEALKFERRRLLDSAESDAHEKLDLLIAQTLALTK